MTIFGYFGGVVCIMGWRGECMTSFIFISCSVDVHTFHLKIWKRYAMRLSVLRFIHAWISLGSLLPATTRLGACVGHLFSVNSFIYSLDFGTRILQTSIQASEQLQNTPQKLLQRRRTSLCVYFLILSRSVIFRTQVHEMATVRTS